MQLVEAVRRTRGLSSPAPNSLCKTKTKIRTHENYLINFRNFKDYWSRESENFENRSGDHIDLWNKNRIAGSSMLYRSRIELFGFASELNKSKEVLI